MTYRPSRGSDQVNGLPQPSKRRSSSLALLLLSAPTLLTPSLSLAQSAAPTDPIDLDTLIIEGVNALDPNASIVAHDTSTGNKMETPLLDLSSSVSVVTEAEMERRGVQDLAQALAYTSGVSVDGYGSDDRYDFYRIRGFYQTSSGTYRDGLPMRISSFTGSRLEPYGMQRLEVLKGSTSSLFGMNAPGGLVNAITKRPKDYAFGEIYTTQGDDHTEFGTDFGGPLDANGEWSYRLTAKWQDGDNGTEYSNDDRLYVAPALTWSPNEATSLTLLADYNERDGNTSSAIPYGSGIDPDTFLGEPDFDSMDTTEKNIGYVFEHAFSDALTFRQKARYTELELTFESVYVATADPSESRTAYAVDGETERFAIDNQLQYDTHFGRVDSRTLVGADYSRDNTDEASYFGSAAGIDIENPSYCGMACITLPDTASDWNQELATAGIYVQEELTFYERWILTLGGRYDDVHTVSENNGTTHDVTDYAFTKSLGLTYKIRRDMSLYANYSESFQPLSANRALIEGSPKPREGTQYEVGFKYSPDNSNALFTLALFDLTQTNVAKNVSPTMQRQIGEINVRGLELEGKMAMSDRLNLIASYSYWDAEIVDDGSGANEGNRPFLVPEQQASLWVDYTIPGNATFGDLTLGLGARYAGSSYADDANTVKVDSHTVFDAMARYRLTQNISVAVNAENLSDEEYISWINTNSNTAYYGDGRTVRATLKYQW